MLFGLLLDELTLADVAAELHTTGNRAVQVVTAPIWMALLSLYSLSTFLGLLTAGFLSKIAPALFTPLFEALLDKVVPNDSSYHSCVPPDLKHAHTGSSSASTCSSSSGGSLGMSSMELGGPKRGSKTLAAAGGSVSSLTVPQ